MYAGSVKVGRHYRARAARIDHIESCSQSCRPVRLRQSGDTQVPRFLPGPRNSFGAGVITAETLTGYILEELLASLIQSAGYRLLVHVSQDPIELAMGQSGDLLVKGRGGLHQVDVLGEFTIVPAFSQPLRLWVEAKARNARTDLRSIRNAVGTINDINEAWMIDYSHHRLRRHYRYALFSTSGFTVAAQNYATAHQIALVDLSGPEWAVLRDSARETADLLLGDVPRHIRRFPVRALRRNLRLVLGTGPDVRLPANDSHGLGAALDLYGAAADLRRTLDRDVNGALLAFPTGSQVLLARPDNLRDFLAFASGQPEHHVTLAPEAERENESSRTWVVRPASATMAYTLRLTLPTIVEELALAESDRRAQSLTAKGALGGRLDIFWDPHGEQASLLLGPRHFRLLFAGADLRMHSRHNLR
jgi:hypothetical protein